MTKEVFKPVVGYENLYEVSNLGNVKSLNYNRSGKPKVLKSISSSSGYLQVRLYINGKGKKILVHRLVAQAFLDNPENYPCIDHVNAIKHDNRVENLRWCTHEMNMLWAYKKTHNRDISVLDEIKAMPNYGDLLVIDESKPIQRNKHGFMTCYVKFINPIRNDHIDGFKQVSSIKRALKLALKTKPPLVQAIKSIPMYNKLLVIDETKGVKHSKHNTVMYWVKFINPVNKRHTDGFKELSNIKKMLTNATNKQINRLPSFVLNNMKQENA